MPIKIKSAVLLSVFAKFQKTTLSFVISVRPLVRVKHFGFHWMDFHEIPFFIIFRKSIKAFQVTLKLTRKQVLK